MVNRIDPTSRTPETQPVKPIAKPAQTARAEGAVRPEADEVNLSAEALARLQATTHPEHATPAHADGVEGASGVSDVPEGESPERTAKLSALKKQIETGTYTISDQALVDKLLKSKKSEK